MLIAGLILGVGVLSVLSFVAGVRYGASNQVLPGVLARMSSERLNDLAARAGEIRTSIAKGRKSRL